jgi:hypothetical protein
MVRDRVRNTVVSLLVCSFVLTANVVMSAEKKVVGYKKWKEFKERIKKDKSVKRYYTFEEGIEVSNEVGSEGGLKYTDLNAKTGEPFAEELSFVDGRWPEKKAVRLDQCAFVGDAYDIEDKNFTLELWIKNNGQGAIDKKNLGHIITSGEGFGNGWILYSNISTNELYFTLGDKSQSTWGIRNVYVTNGVWQHIVYTWDSEFFTVYINGELKNKKKCEGDYVKSTRPLLIGGARHLNSMILDIDEIIIYNRVITAEEVKEHYEVIK